MQLTGDLETDIMNQLQEKKSGQTIEELSQHLKKTQGEILTVLNKLQKENLVALKYGVWIMVRQ
jgi:predicted transcriptional regulator